MTTTISPAAQAISLAAAHAHFAPVDERLRHNVIAAAALRAAASQLREAYANEEYVDSADDWLDDLARELEAGR